MQVNQNVNAANFLLVSSQAGNISSVKENTSSTVDFASALQNANENRQYHDTTNLAQDKMASTSKKDYKDVTEVDDATMNAESTTSKDSAKVEAKDDSKQLTETKETAQSDEDKVEKVEDASEVESPETIDVAVVEKLDGVENLSDEELAVLLETVGNLLQNVMEQFGLSLEEFTAKLEEFDMQPADLLTQDGLKQFFLQMNNADISDLVVDENLNMQLQSFMESVAEELTVLQNTTVDVESVIAEFDVKSLLDNASNNIATKSVEDIVVDVDDDSVPVVMDETEGELVVTEEPEVIVSDNRTQNKNSSGESKQQSTESKLQQSTTTETVVADNTISNENTFENPILQAIQNAVNNVEGAVVSEQPVQQTDVVRQIVEQVRLNMNQQQTSLELQLYPEHLGRIQINVVSKEGVMTASIVAETEAAKQAIEAGLLNLKETMEQQNLKVEAIEVMVSTMGFEKGDEQQQSFDEKGSSNPRRKIDLSELGEEIPVEDEAEVEKMKASGSSVSYRA